MVLVFLLVTGALPPGQAAAEHGAAPLDLHPPVVIVGDEGPTGFILARTPTGAPVYRPGSGVTGGNGTPEDPYVIEGLRASVLVLAVTTAHVIIRDSVLVSDTEDAPALRLTHVRNVTVANSTVKGGTSGLLVGDGAHVTIAGNHVEGKWGPAIDVRETVDSAIEHNTAHTGRSWGIRLRNSDRNVIEGNTASSNSIAIYLNRSAENRVVSNRVTDAQYGIGLHERSPRNVVHGNVLEGELDNAILLFDAADTVVTGNRINLSKGVAVSALIAPNLTIQGNEVSLHALWDTAFELISCPNGTVVDNRVRGGTYGVRVWQSNQLQISGNHIEDTQAAVVVEADVHGGRIFDNVFRARGTGVTLQPPGSFHIHDNLFEGGYTGLYSTVPDILVEHNTFANNTIGAQPDLITTGSVIRENLFTSNLEFGLMTGGSRGGHLADNVIRDSGTGNVGFTDSREVRLTGNVMTGPGVVFDNSFPHLAYFLHDMDRTNLVNGAPLAYVRDAGNVTLGGPVGQVILANVTRADVRNLTLEGLAVAVRAEHSRNVTLTNVSVVGNTVGVLAHRAAGLTVRNSTVTGNADGIVLQASGRAFVTDTGVTGNRYGIFAMNSPGNGVTVTRSTLADNTDAGILVLGGNGTRLASNEVTRNGGAGVKILWAETTTLRHNNLHGNHGPGVDANREVDATENWWGCAGGPADDGCDPVSGDVLYDPWLTAPADAGAS